MRCRRANGPVWLILLILLATLCFPASAESAAPRTVRVGCGFSNALYLDESGKPQGYCAHYLRQIAWLQNWTLEYVPVAWPEALEKMRGGELDLLLPVQPSEERSAYLDYSQYFGGYEAIGLYAGADTSLCFNEFDALDHKKIGVEKDNLCSQDLERFAQEHGLRYTLSVYDTAQRLDEALESGEIDLLASSTMNTVPGSKLVALLDYVPFYYCVAKGDAALLSELNDGMRDVMINSPDMAVTVFESTLKGTAVVGYTRAEEEVISGTNRIVFAMYDDSLPLSGHSADGECIGIYVDLLKAIEASTGIAMEPLLVSTDDNIFSTLSSGAADYIMCSSHLPYVNEDVTGFLGSDPIIDYATVAVTRPDYNLDSAQAPVIALTTYRTYLEARIYAEHPDAKIVYHSTAKECMVAVQQREADATYINSWEYNYHSKNPRFQGLMEWENTRISSDVIVVANAGRNEAWLSIVDKAFHQLSADALDDMIARNVNMSYSSFDSADQRYALGEYLKPFAAVLLFLLCLLGIYLYMRRQNMRALMEKNRELESANEAKSAFLSRMSHELRTPLNAIAGYAQEQENNCLSASFDAKAELQSASAIQRAVRYQQSIIGDLLDIQQIESGRIQLAMEEVDAAAYLNGLVEMIRPEAEARQIHFTCDRLTATNETYLADPVRLQQILLNLLHNAIKFTPEGGSVHLTAQAVKQEGSAVRLRFAVADTGIGMSQEFIDTKLFKNFAQEHSGATSPYEGCGIGLATCRELVRLMNGSIACESAQGQGTTFTVEILVEALPPKKHERKKREPVPCDLQGVHMLLCEDNQMNQEIEKRLLERMGCTVDIAENGAVGCQLFGQSEIGAYHMILMDIRMPEMDGLEATRTIRAMQRSDAATVPIVAVSANAFEEDVRQSLAAGMNEHLAKPMDVRVIHEKVLHYCFHQG